MLNIKGVDYYFTDHALWQMEKRSIPEDWVRQTITSPDKEPEYDEERDNYRYEKIFRYDNLVHRLRVVVDENFHNIITVMYQD